MVDLTETSASRIANSRFQEYREQSRISNLSSPDLHSFTDDEYSTIHWHVVYYATYSGFARTHCPDCYCQPQILSTTRASPCMVPEKLALMRTPGVHYLLRCWLSRRAKKSALLAGDQTCECPETKAQCTPTLLASEDIMCPNVARPRITIREGRRRVWIGNEIIDTYQGHQTGGKRSLSSNHNNNQASRLREIGSISSKGSR